MNGDVICFMDNKDYIIIGLIIVIVGVVALFAGFALAGNNNPTITSNVTVNNTTNSTNDSVSTNTKDSSDSKNVAVSSNSHTNSKQVSNNGNLDEEDDEKKSVELQIKEWDDWHQSNIPPDWDKIGGNDGIII